MAKKLTVKYVIVFSLLILVSILSYISIQKQSSGGVEGSRVRFARVSIVASIASSGPQSLLAYPSPGCGSLIALRVEKDDKLHIFVINTSSKVIVGESLSAYQRGDWYRGFTICDGVVYELISRGNNSVIYWAYSAGDHPVKGIIKIDNFRVPSMVVDGNKIVLVGVNESIKPPKIVLLIFSRSGRLIAKHVLPWNLEKLVGSGSIDTGLFLLKPGIYLVAFVPRWVQKVGDIYMSIISVEGSRVRISRLMILPKGFSIVSLVHALLYRNKLYVLYAAPGKTEAVPAVYVYNVTRGGSPAAIYSNPSIPMRGGFLLVIGGDVYAVLLSPLLLSTALPPIPKAAASIVIVKVEKGLPIIGKIPVKVNKSFVDWDYISLNVPVHDLDGDGIVDILAKAFDVFNAAVGEGTIYLININLPSTNHNERR